MLEGMRKHAKYFYVLFFIVILSFVFWGVGPLDKPTSVVVAEVGSDKVTVEEFWRAYDNARNTYREIFKDQFNEEMEKQLNLKEAVLDSIIEERVLLATASDMGMAVSDSEVQEMIVNDQRFRRDGAFKKEVYFRTLELNRMSPDQYERMLRRQLALDKVKRLVWASVDVTPLDVPSTGGDDQKTAQLQRSILAAKRDAAMKSFIDAARASMQVKVYRDRIS
ncbi:MAG TPA: SurA N-terminal domain-containing protein [Dissulfurispiraceae bacterium]|nr:SurA N-terminal domain-containing protein [Dissulfurispiraceae bacterium]